MTDTGVICSLQTNTQSWDMRSLEQTMSDLGHAFLSVLKIDVEGSEWTAVAAMLESRKMRYRGMCCMHDVSACP